MAVLQNQGRTALAQAIASQALYLALHLRLHIDGRTGLRQHRSGRHRGNRHGERRACF